MTATISADNGAGSTVPTTVLSEYTTTRASRSVIHDLIGGGIAVSLVAPRPRSGELSLLYPSEVEADLAAQLHMVETTFSLEDDDAPSIGMRYVVDGDIRVALDEDTLTQWIVSIGFQEVGAATVRGIR